MPVLSVDLAYKRFKDVGIAYLFRNEQQEIVCEFIRPDEEPISPQRVAAILDAICRERSVHILLLDGPQGWKGPETALVHSRICERELNTPAKTGLHSVVKPANYTAFVEFSIAVYDKLCDLGWSRLTEGSALGSGQRVLVESFPLSAWRSLGLPPLPAKAKAKPSDLQARLTALMRLFPIRVDSAPTHDELQALVSGLAGIALEHREPSCTRFSGIPPFVNQGVWCEGYIVNPVLAGS